MKYTCNTQGCGKEHIVYDRPDYDGSEPLDCTLCGERCAVDLDPEPTPEPEVEPQPDQATVGVDQYELPSQGLWALVEFYSRYYGEDRAGVLRLLRSDIRLLEE